MKRAVILLQRTLTMTKEVWRAPNTRRTFSVLDAGPLLIQAWRECGERIQDRSLVVAKLTTDGLAFEGAPAVLEGPTKSRGGIFAVEWQAAGAVVRLDPKLCLQAVGSPAREQKRFGLQAAWSPVHVIINGRSVYTSGVLYSIADYYFCLAEGEPPGALPPLQSHNLQGDLF